MIIHSYVTEVMQDYRKYLRIKKKRRVEIPEHDPNDPKRVGLGTALLKLHQEATMYHIATNTTMFDLKPDEDFRFIPDFETEENLRRWIQMAWDFIGGR